MVSGSCAYFILATLGVLGSLGSVVVVDPVLNVSVLIVLGEERVEIRRGKKRGNIEGGVNEGVAS